MLWLVGLGGSLGAGTRYWLGRVLANKTRVISLLAHGLSMLLVPFCLGCFLTCI